MFKFMMISNNYCDFIEVLTSVCEILIKNLSKTCQKLENATMYSSLSYFKKYQGFFIFYSFNIVFLTKKCQLTKSLKKSIKKNIDTF